MRRRLPEDPPACASPEEGRRSLVIVDSDLGFAFWLGQALDAAGYVTAPAQNARSALELVFSSSARVEALIIDPAERDAVSFIAHLKRLDPPVKAIAAFTPGRPPVSDLPIFDAAAPKPERRTTAAAQAWVDLVRALAPPALGGSSLSPAGGA